MLRITDFFILAVLLSCAGCMRSYTGSDGKTYNGLSVTSTAFKEGETIPAKYTCDGECISPPIAWNGVPQKTASFALIVDDPDATYHTYVHWVLYNIPASVTKLEEHFPHGGSFANGMLSGINDRGCSVTFRPARRLAHIATSSKCMPWTAC